MDQYPEASYSDKIDTVCSIFSLIYFVEVLLSLTAYGFKVFIQSATNKFDLIIVVVSAIDVFISFSIGHLSVNNLTALRMFRMLRVFKLAKFWKTFRKLLGTVLKTLKDIASFSIILFLFMYIYAVLGMELFSNKVKFDDNDMLDLQNGTPLNSNFDSFL